MTDIDPDLLALDGETIFVLAESGLNILLEPSDDDWHAFPRAAFIPRGGSLLLSLPVLRASLDRNGRSWLLEDEMTQREKYGHVRFAFEWPDGEPVLIPGSAEALVRADEERKLAWRTRTGPALAAALRDIDRRLGRGGTHSTVLTSDRRSTERVEMDAAEQRRLVAAELQRQQDAARTLGGLG